MRAEYITPAVTPFMENGTPDWESLEGLYEHLISGGISGILILGSIGEFFAIPLETKKEIIRFAANKIGGRVKFFAGTGSMIPGETAELSRFALEAGADGVVVISPYYFSLTQESIYDFYADIAEKVPGDIYIYNFPDRTGYNIAPETMGRLAENYSNIAGCKDTMAGMDHTREVIKRVKSVRPEFKVYSGFDDNFGYNVLSGGDGCIGGLSNVAPGFFKEWIDAFAREDVAVLAEKQQKINRLMDIYSVGTPFVPYIKAAMKALGIIKSDKASFPLPSADEAQVERLLEILKDQ